MAQRLHLVPVHQLASLIFFFQLQGEQTVLAYSCRRSFRTVCMVLGVIACHCWSSNSWAEFWSFHYFFILPWSFPWNHLFRPPISDEEISCCGISYNSHGMVLFNAWCISLVFLEELSFFATIKTKMMVV